LPVAFAQHHITPQVEVCVTNFLANVFLEILFLEACQAHEICQRLSEPLLLKVHTAYGVEVLGVLAHSLST
jgi:hypothetical protein